MPLPVPQLCLCPPHLYTPAYVFLQGCDGACLEKDAYCTICYTEPVGQSPALRLGCGHGFHFLCVKAMLEAKWNGPRINFGFMSCPLCKVWW